MLQRQDDVTTNRDGPGALLTQSQFNHGGGSGNSADLSPQDLKMLTRELELQMKAERTDLVRWGDFELDLPRNFWRVFGPVEYQGKGPLGSELEEGHSSPAAKSAKLVNDGAVDPNEVAAGVSKVVRDYLETMGMATPDVRAGLPGKFVGNYTGGEPSSALKVGDSNINHASPAVAATGLNTTSTTTTVTKPNKNRNVEHL